MTMVTRPWNDGTIEVDEKHLERAKELVHQFGITNISDPAKILEEELNLDRFDAYATKLLVLAMDDTASEREAELRGWMRAINFLRELSEKPNPHTGEKNLTQWAVLVSAADILENHLEEAVKTPPKKEVCDCRCMQGKNCGGCGHEGCGYSKSAWVLRG